MNTGTLIGLGAAGVLAYLLYEAFEHSDYAGNVVTGIQTVNTNMSDVSSGTSTSAATPLTGAESVDLRSGLLQIAQNALNTTADGNGGQFSTQNGLIYAQATTWDFYAGMLGYYKAQGWVNVSGWGLCTIDFYLGTVRNSIPPAQRNVLIGATGSSGVSGLGGFGVMYRPQWRSVSKLELINTFNSGKM